MHTRSRDFSTFEAAAELGVDRSTISRWIARGILRAERYHQTAPARIAASEIARLRKTATDHLQLPSIAPSARTRRVHAA